MRELIQRRTVQAEADRGVPAALQLSAAYAWRFLVIAAAIGVIVWLVIQLKLLVIPALAAIVLTALVWPAMQIMLRARFPRWLAVVITLLGTILIVVGLLWLVGWQVSVEWPSVRDRSIEAFKEFQAFLINGPFQLTQEQIDQFIAEAVHFIETQGQWFVSGALVVGSTFGQIITGALLALFMLICFLFDGRGIWKWIVGLFPQKARAAVDASAFNGWRTVINYARTQLFVATIDAVGIGLGALLLGVPLAVPVAVLVFLGSFIPIVGAVLTGAFAVFLALVYNGIWIAIWMLVVVLFVQQFEGHVLQPIMMGSAVKVHPLAVVIAVAGGAMIAGIPGALFAVPLAAFINVVAVTLSTGSWRTGEQPDAALIWSTVPVKVRRRRR